MIRKCYNCGKNSNKLIEGLCKECFKKKQPPIKEVKTLNIKYCNSCKRIFFLNKYYEPDKFLELLKKKIKDYVVIDKNYELKSINITDFTYEKGKISFNINVDASLK